VKGCRLHVSCGRYSPGGCKAGFGYQIAARDYRYEQGNGGNPRGGHLTRALWTLGRLEENGEAEKSKQKVREIRETVEGKKQRMRIPMKRSQNSLDGRFGW
jgi:hypothetical protein